MEFPNPKLTTLKKKQDKQIVKREREIRVQVSDAVHLGRNSNPPAFWVFNPFTCPNLIYEIKCEKSKTRGLMPITKTKIQKYKVKKFLIYFFKLFNLPNFGI